MRTRRIFWFFSIVSLATLASGSAWAAAITARLVPAAEMDGRSEGPASPETTSMFPINAQIDSYVFDLFLFQEGSDAAATFEGEFSITGDVSAWDISLDVSLADPGVNPFGRGTWDALGNITADDRLLLSHLPTDLNNPDVGGERLLATLVLTNLSPAPLSVFYSGGTAAMADAMEIPISTQPGTELLFVPEPGTGLLFTGGLLALAARRRGRTL